jgi:hypothetical protein
MKVEQSVFGRQTLATGALARAGLVLRCGHIQGPGCRSRVRMRSGAYPRMPTLLGTLGTLECRRGGFQRENGPEPKDAKSKKLASLVASLGGSALVFARVWCARWPFKLSKYLSKVAKLATLDNMKNSRAVVAAAGLKKLPEQGIRRSEQEAENQVAHSI